MRPRAPIEAMHELEAGTRLSLDFEKLRAVAAGGSDVVPAVVQHADTCAILILAYVNAEALRETLQRGIAVFWSTSRSELWIKGATSGDVLDVVDVRVNCEQNALLYRVRPRTGGVCHTRDAEGNHRNTCFYRKLEDFEQLSFVARADAD